MNIYCVFCTRSSEKISKTTQKLLEFMAKCEIKTLVMAGADSIFSAYEKAFNHVKPNDEDIFIFCHDDIEIREEPKVFKDKLEKALTGDAGFIGPAGTTRLSENAVWWDHELWKAGFHRGFVIHLDKQNKEYDTPYGPPGEVVVLDGLFLATRAKTVKEVGLKKPEYFEGEWDFYDIHYTTTAHLKGFKNKAIHMNIVHNSGGELVGRDSWHKNREAYIKNTSLPLQVKI